MTTKAGSGADVAVAYFAEAPFAAGFAVVAAET